ncbi:hypothetical protein BISA_1937 [Bifidobacterium saguini DSM 23967]|uniref:Uncharacterized protein n=3 Tax=Bifidobacterium saguini TaxID=762210 RepID=A0A087D608_9BIFI|nr:hypothetical protein [Bifidobacterium saguini]KFI90958.1 hypothetical protein BISA_1937 [Bifidobacterium saguini DSM 23967]QTB91450.1 hypothetical protein BSD967_03235 [Bifidobacterium saguini]
MFGWLYRRFFLFAAVFVGLVFAVCGFWLLLGVTCLCAGMVTAELPERLEAWHGF